jgi:hypothetical protein
MPFGSRSTRDRCRYGGAISLARRACIAPACCLQDLGHVTKAPVSSECPRCGDATWTAPFDAFGRERVPRPPRHPRIRGVFVVGLRPPHARRPTREPRPRGERIRASVAYPWSARARRMPAGPPANRAPAARAIRAFVAYSWSARAPRAIRAFVAYSWSARARRAIRAFVAYSWSAAPRIGSAPPRPAPSAPSAHPWRIRGRPRPGLEARPPRPAPFVHSWRIRGRPAPRAIRASGAPVKTGKVS